MSSSYTITFQHLPTYYPAIWNAYGRALECCGIDPDYEDGCCMTNGCLFVSCIACICTAPCCFCICPVCTPKEEAPVKSFESINHDIAIAIEIPDDVCIADSEMLKP